MSEPLNRARTLASRLVDNVSKALAGKRDVVQLSVACLFARGHLLLEDQPGVGKTTLAKALASSLDATFRRIQCTSDLLPLDLLGTSIYDPKESTFTFRAGPLFTQILLVDELNRASPKTQSALLEAMGERQVSLDGTTRALDDAFFVIATQNPLDQWGTFPLPESQLDRFMARIGIGHAAKDVERAVLAGTATIDASRLTPVGTIADLRDAQHALDHVHVDDAVLDYLHAIVLATRSHPMLTAGASTRAALSLERCARARAVVAGREFVTPDDVKSLGVPVLAHRLRASSSSATGARNDASAIVGEILGSLEVPT